MRLPRRVALAAAATAMTAPWPVPAGTEQDAGERELQLEAELQRMLGEAGAPAAILTRAQAESVDTVIRQLESLRGRQQRAGWGQSDARYDLPMIGAWDVLYASQQSAYSAAADGDGERPRLVWARQWIYGPGVGGVGSECVYASQPAGPAGGDVLLTRTGNLTKLDGARLRLDLERGSRAFGLSYVTRELVLAQASNGSWVETARERPTATPSVGVPLGAAPVTRLCSPAGGLYLTTFLSDTLWMVRRDDAGGGGDVTVLRRTEAEALRPQNGAGPDGFDAGRFGPSGRRLWMFDTGYSDKEEAAQQGRRRVRADQEISAS